MSESARDQSTSESTPSSSGTVLSSVPSSGSTSTSPAPTTTSTPSGSWRDTLSDDLKSDPSLSNIQDINSLAKSYVSAQKMVGADKIAIPGKLATEQDWQQVYKKLGMPDSVDKYEVKPSENSLFNDTFMKGYKEEAMKAGVLPKQAQSLMNWYEKITDSELKAVQAKQAEAVQTGISNLKQEWGQGYDKNVAAAQVAVKELGGEELTKFLESSGLGNHPMMIKLMAKVGQNFLEDKIPAPGAAGFQGKTPDEAQREINSINSDRSHPYHNAEHPNHKAAVDDMSKLFIALTNGK